MKNTWRNTDEYKMITANLSKAVTNRHFFTNSSNRFRFNTTAVDLINFQMKYITNEILYADRLSILHYHLLPNSLLLPVLESLDS